MVYFASKITVGEMKNTHEILKIFGLSTLMVIVIVTLFVQYPQYCKWNHTYGAGYNTTYTLKYLILCGNMQNSIRRITASDH